MKRMKRYLSSLMAVVMLLTLLPTAALAVEKADPQTEATTASASEVHAASAAPEPTEPVTVTMTPSSENTGNVSIDVTIHKTAEDEVLDIPAIAHTALDQWYQMWQERHFDPGAVVFFHLNVTNNSKHTYRYVAGSAKTTPDKFDFQNRDSVVLRTLNPALFALIRGTQLTLEDYNASEQMKEYFQDFKKAMTVWDNGQTMDSTDDYTVASIDKCFRVSIISDHGKRSDAGATESKWSRSRNGWLTLSNEDLFASDECVAAHLYKYYKLAEDPATKDLKTADIIETYLDQYYCEYYKVASLDKLSTDQLKELFGGVEKGTGVQLIAPDTYKTLESAHPDNIPFYFPETNSAVAEAGWRYLYGYLLTFGLWNDHTDLRDPDKPEYSMGYLLETPSILGNATSEKFPGNPAYLDNVLGGERGLLTSLAPGETAKTILMASKNGPYTRNCYWHRVNDFSFSFQMDREKQPEVLTGDLQISKTVQGENAPAGQAFDFTLTLDAKPAISGTFGNVTVANNQAAFQLADGASVSLKGLPAGIGYTITEAPVEHYSAAVKIDGQTADAASGQIQAGKTAAVEFVNSYEAPAPEPEKPTPQWDTSKSKTATNLDKKFQSQVTLSLPAAEEKLVSDVVFVLDESSCSKEVKDEVSKMLNTLYTHIKGTNAEINIGAVQFRGSNKELPLTPLNADTAKTIQDFMSSRPKIGGSNMHAGLLAGEKMLDADNTVSAERKYLILVSDGIAYIWDKDNDASTKADNMGVNYSNADVPDKPFLASPDGWDVKYGHQYVPTSWDKHMKTMESMLDTTIADKASDYFRFTDISKKSFVKPTEQENYISTVDIALYKSMKTYESVLSKYHVFVVNTGKESEMSYYPYGPSFMEYLADGKTVTFEQIQNDIYYLLDAGSRVKDVIGSGKDNKGNAYDMDFLPKADALTLTVGGKALPVTDLTNMIEPDAGFNGSAFETARFGFGEKDSSKDKNNYAFVLHYFAKGEDGKSDECFVWDINVPVSNFAPVQLTYTVKLTNPQKAAGTYGTFDADGSEKLPGGLYTNKSAALYPVDSNGKVGASEAFAKPTVSYTVKSSGGGGGGGGGGSHKPVLNTKDHYSYIIGYKDGFVRPYGTITRGEVVTIFFRLLTDDARDKYWSQTNPFSDCNSDLWCNNAISTLYNMGQETGVHIIDGFQDGTFRPYGKITRAQFAKITVGFFEETAKEYEGLYTDVADNAWYTSYIEAASRVGLIQGFEDGTFRPNVNITRAQSCVIVNRALDRHPTEEHLLPTRVMVNWPDNNPGDWYYADMMEATNSHDYRWKNTNDCDEHGKRIRYEDWTDKLAQRDWAAYEHAWSNSHSSTGGEVVKG